jgi:hypothetical protein
MFPNQRFSNCRSFLSFCRPSTVKKEEEEEKSVKEESVEEAEPKKEPLSLEELLAKKQAEEAARSKVRERCFVQSLLKVPYSTVWTVEAVYNLAFITTAIIHITTGFAHFSSRKLPSTTHLQWLSPIIVRHLYNDPQYWTVYCY